MDGGEEQVVRFNARWLRQASNEQFATEFAENTEGMFFRSVFSAASISQARWDSL